MAGIVFGTSIGLAGWMGAIAWGAAARWRYNHVNPHGKKPAEVNALHTLALQIVKPDQALGLVTGLVALIATVTLALGAMRRFDGDTVSEALFDKLRLALGVSCYFLGIYGVFLALGQVVTRSETAFPTAVLAVFGVLLATPLTWDRSPTALLAEAARLTPRVKSLQAGIDLRRHVPAGMPLKRAWARRCWSLVALTVAATLVVVGITQALALLPGRHESLLSLSVGAGLSLALVHLAAVVLTNVPEHLYRQGRRGLMRWPAAMVAGFTVAVVLIVASEGFIKWVTVGAVAASQYLVSWLAPPAILAALAWRGRNGGLGKVWWDRALTNAEAVLADHKERLQVVLKRAGAAGSRPGPET